jgi:hypothetical protein
MLQLCSACFTSLSGRRIVTVENQQSRVNMSSKHEASWIETIRNMALEGECSARLFLGGYVAQYRAV